MAVEKSSIARPYAKAAFEFARDNQQIEAWSQVLQFAAMISEDERVQHFLQQPQVKTQEHFELFIDLITAQFKNEFSDSQKNFIHQLAQRGRLAVLFDIALIFAKYRAEYEQTVTVEVCSFAPLTELQEDKLVRKLEQRFKRQVTLDCTVNENLLGGAIIKAKEVIDGSVRNQLNKLAQKLAS